MTKRTNSFSASRAKSDVTKLVSCVAKPKPRRVKAALKGNHSFGWYWDFPATAAAYDAMVEQMAKAKARTEGYRYTRFMYGYQDDARAMLRAIGISRPKD